MRSSWRVHSSTSWEKGRCGGGWVWANASGAPASTSRRQARRKRPRMALWYHVSPLINVVYPPNSGKRRRLTGAARRQTGAQGQMTAPQLTAWVPAGEPFAPN